MYLIEQSTALPESLRLKPAPDPLNISEGQIAKGEHLQVTALSRCMGIGLESGNPQSDAVAAHIGPFGGEHQDRLKQVYAWADAYIEQLANSFGDKQPSLVTIRSREIGSNPLFHGRMYEAVKRRFPNAQINIRNGTGFEIESAK